MAGVILFLIILAFGFSGYLLPWDQRGYWATQVGTNIVGTIPWVGNLLIRIIRGGQQVGALTLNRFYALHTLFLPLTVVIFIALHLFLPALSSNLTWGRCLIIIGKEGIRDQVSLTTHGPIS